MFGWLFGDGGAASEPATDYELSDGRGVYVDPDSGAALAGQVVDTPAGAFVAVQGQSIPTGDGFYDWQAAPAPDGWQGQVVRGWRG